MRFEMWSKSTAPKIRVVVSIVVHDKKHFIDELIPVIGASDYGVSIVLIENLRCKQFFNVKYSVSSNIFWYKNITPHSFASNHNFVFKNFPSDVFIPLNPDVRLTTQQFDSWIDMHLSSGSYVSGPKLLCEQGLVNGSPRRFGSFFPSTKTYVGETRECARGKFWLSGAALAFDSSIYEFVEGFDARYKLYCEDIDICRSIVNAGYDICWFEKIVCFHHAQRMSHRNLSYFLLHISSIIKYILKWYFRKFSTLKDIE